MWGQVTYPILEAPKGGSFHPWEKSPVSCLENDPDFWPLLWPKVSMDFVGMFLLFGVKQLVVVVSKPKILDHFFEISGELTRSCWGCK